MSDPEGWSPMGNEPMDYAKLMHWLNITMLQTNGAIAKIVDKKPVEDTLTQLASLSENLTGIYKHLQTNGDIEKLGGDLIELQGVKLGKWPFQIRSPTNPNKPPEMWAILNHLPTLVMFPDGKVALTGQINKGESKLANAAVLLSEAMDKNDMSLLPKVKALLEEAE